MCEVTTALMAVSLATTVIGGMQQAQAQGAAAAREASQSYYAAGVARNNQIAASYAAKDAIERGKIDRAQAAIRSRQLQGQQRAGLAAAGADVNSGSALALTEETRRLGELDQLVATNNAQREALGFTTQANNFGGEVGLHTAAGGNALASGKAAQQATLISTAGSVASKWYSFKS